MKPRFPFLLSVFAILLFWQILAVIVQNPLILPSVALTCARLFELCSQASFLRSVLFSVARVFAGFLLAMIFGGAAGVLCGVFPFFRDFLAFPLAVVRSVPVVSFILLAIFAFDSDFVPVFSAFLMGFPVMTGAVSSGFDFDENDKKLFFMAKVFHLKKSQKIRFILLVKLRPFLESGIFSVFGMSWKVVAAAEVLSVPKNAVGAVLQNAQVHLESATVLSATIVIVMLSFLFEKILRLIFKFGMKKATSLKSSGRSPSGRASSIPSTMQVAQEVKITNLNISFGGKVLFKNFSITFEAGKTTAILAPSGSGKTTLLNWIATHYEVSFLFQEPRLLPTLTVFENVFLPLSNIFPPDEAAEIAKKYLSEAELSDKLDRTTENLSGGEKQRVAMARAFAFPSSVLLLDEAFQSLDEKIKKSLERTLKNLLKKTPRTVIFVTHQKDEAEAVADKIVEFTL